MYIVGSSAKWILTITNLKIYIFVVELNGLEEDKIKLYVHSKLIANETDLYYILNIHQKNFSNIVIYMAFIV